MFCPYLSELHFAQLCLCNGFPLLYCKSGGSKSDPWGLPYLVMRHYDISHRDDLLQRETTRYLSEMRGWRIRRVYWTILWRIAPVGNVNVLLAVSDNSIGVYAQIYRTFCFTCMVHVLLLYNMYLADLVIKCIIYLNWSNGEVFGFFSKRTWSVK